MFRENIEEFYSGIEHYIDAQKSAAETIGIVTRFGSERIVHAAFEYARKYGRKKVTIVHKANIMKFSGGLFLEVAREVAQKYPEIIAEDRIVDNMAMQLVLNPNQFDVIVTTNLFGIFYPTSARVWSEGWDWPRARISARMPQSLKRCTQRTGYCR